MMRGFTLVELMVVIVIIGIFAGIVLVGTQGAVDDGKKSKAQNDVNQIFMAVERFKMRCQQAGLDRELPENLQELIDGPAGWDEQAKGPWLPTLHAREIPKDPWGGEYQLVVLRAETGQFEIRSLGKDKQPGGLAPYNEDIVYLPPRSK